jgi:uncharacterized membrane protein YiaA
LASISRFLRASIRVEPGEVSATLSSFMFVLVLMTAYSIQKPVRDALGGDWDEADLAMTWTVNFLFSVVAVSLYGAALSAFDFRRVVRGIYVFFALTFFGLWAVTVNVAEPTLFNKIFYVWVSIFSLFHLSVFWSYMADLYDRGQAARLFGFIAAGTSAGAIIGPALTIPLAKVIGNDGLMLLSALLLLVPVPMVLYLERLRPRIAGEAADARQQPVLRFLPVRQGPLPRRDRRFHPVLRDDQHLRVFRVAGVHGRIRDRHAHADLGHDRARHQRLVAVRVGVRHEPHRHPARHAGGSRADAGTCGSRRAARRGGTRAADAGGVPGAAPCRQLCRDAPEPRDAVHGGGP